MQRKLHMLLTSKAEIERWRPCHVVCELQEVFIANRSWACEADLV